MKELFSKNTALVLLLSLFSQAMFAQSISLPKESKFKFGDNPEWANPAFNDNDWANSTTGKKFY